MRAFGVSDFELWDCDFYFAWRGSACARERGCGAGGAVSDSDCDAEESGCGGAATGCLCAHEGGNDCDFDCDCDSGFSGVVSESAYVNDDVCVEGLDFLTGFWPFSRTLNHFPAQLREQLSLCREKLSSSKHSVQSRWHFQQVPFQATPFASAACPRSSPLCLVQPQTLSAQKRLATTFEG